MVFKSVTVHRNLYNVSNNFKRPNSLTRVLHIAFEHRVLLKGQLIVVKYFGLSDWKFQTATWKSILMVNTLAICFLVHLRNAYCGKRCKPMIHRLWINYYQIEYLKSCLFRKNNCWLPWWKNTNSSCTVLHKKFSNSIDADFFRLLYLHYEILHRSRQTRLKVELTIMI